MHEETVTFLCRVYFFKLVSVLLTGHQLQFEVFS